MDAGEVARVRAWLDREAASELTPGVATSLAAAWADSASLRVRRRPGGTLVLFRSVAGARCRVLELDPSGTALAWLHWDATGRLQEGSLRLPDRSWVLIEPCSTRAAPWGLSDRLWHGRTAVRNAESRPLSLFAAVDYAAVSAVPALAEPARLPPGAGTTVLNLLASLAEDQGTTALAYDGPYPTEALFLALQESFDFEDAPANPLVTFLAGGLTWRPAPHERRFAGECYVQRRHRIEKVVWRGRTYYRAVWQGVARHAPRRLRDVPGGMRCCLWALGEPIEDHVALDDAGEVTAILLPATGASPLRPIPPSVVTGIVAAVAATSAPALGPFIRGQATELVLEWGPVEGDLLAVAGVRIRISSRLRDTARRRARTVIEPDASDPAARDPGLATRGPASEALGSADAPATGRDDDPRAVALALFAELATLLGDELRARAQAHVSRLPPAEQARVMETGEPAPASSTSDEITAAVAALLGDLADA